MNAQSRTGTSSFGAIDYSASSLPLFWPAVAACLLSAIAVSFFCGYHTIEAPFEIKWQFTPVGLLQNFDPRFLELRSHAGFTGTYEWNWDYFMVFAKTCALESPFYWIALRSRGSRVFTVSLLAANFMTHPIVFFFFPWVFSKYLVSALSAELFAHVSEATLLYFVCRALNFRNPRIAPAIPTPLIVALLIVAANLFSWQMGAYV